MPDRDQRTPKNVPGKFYVDCRCLDHALCQQLAPNNFARDDEQGWYYVCKQPETSEELAQCKQAVESCPMAAIGTDGEKP
jgi:ferredoxin